MSDKSKFTQTLPTGESYTKLSPLDKLTYALAHLRSGYSGGTSYHLDDILDNALEALDAGAETKSGDFAASMYVCKPRLAIDPVMIAERKSREETLRRFRQAVETNRDSCTNYGICITTAAEHLLMEAHFAYIALFHCRVK